MRFLLAKKRPSSLRELPPSVLKLLPGQSCVLPGVPHACALAPWRTVLLVDKVGALAGEAELRFETKGLWIKMDGICEMGPGSCRWRHHGRRYVFVEEGGEIQRFDLRGAIGQCDVPTTLQVSRDSRISARRADAVRKPAAWNKCSCCRDDQ
eukprot:superscaffoldBa00002758_g15204